VRKKESISYGCQPNFNQAEAVNGDCFLIVHCAIYLQTEKTFTRYLCGKSAKRMKMSYKL